MSNNSDNDATFAHWVCGLYPPARIEAIRCQLKAADESLQGSGKIETRRTLGSAGEAKSGFLLLDKAAPDLQPLAPGQFVLGRSPECDWRFFLKFVSRIHCVLNVYPDGRVTIRDLSSANGTFVNGCRLAQESYELKHEDKVEFGGYRLLFVTKEKGRSDAEDKTLAL